jgi:hypothetical protein
VVGVAGSVPAGARALGRRKPQRSLNQTLAARQSGEPRGSSGVGIPIASFQGADGQGRCCATPTKAAQGEAL